MQTRLQDGARSVDLRGGAHHTVYSYALTSEHLEDFAEIAGIELVVIDDHTRLREFRNELRQNDLYYTVAQGLRN